jgi:glycosyltransferase involved in cell wall biosynthesis
VAPPPPPAAVSVVMSVLNSERTVGAALASIRAQTFSDWEFIVLDDGSRDGTAHIVAAADDSRIKLVRGEATLGLAARLNQGIALARGRYIARMDGDDIAYPERLERQFAHMEANGQVDLLGSAAMVFSGPVSAIGVYRIAERHEEICARPEVGFALAHPTWFGRREWFGEAPYRLGVFRAEDQDLLLRRHKHSHFANLPDVLLGYRQERLRARHILHGRWHYTRALVAFAGQSGDPLLAARGIGLQATRGAVTLALIGIGRDRAIFARRFRVPASEELARWLAVRDNLTREQRST